MNEKQAKKKRKLDKTEPLVLMEFTIKIMDNGDVAVNGPVDKYMAFLDATNRAQRMVLDHAFKLMEQQMAPKSNILVPNLDTSKLKLH